MLISPSERLDVVIDFAGLLGQTLYLRDERSGIDLMQIRVTQDMVDDSTVPSTLRSLPDLGEPTVTRTFTFSRVFGKWVINNKSFNPDRVDAFPVLGSTEKWILQTSTLDGGALHAIHIHDVDQQCLSRNGAPCPAYEATKEAWLMQPGDVLEVKLRFSDHLGKYMFHCHFLEHEDDGMMSQFEVLGPTPSAAATGTPTPTPTPAATPTPTPTPEPTPPATPTSPATVAPATLTPTAAPVSLPNTGGASDPQATVGIALALAVLALAAGVAASVVLARR
jgi:cell division septation protein DedD